MLHLVSDKLADPSAVQPALLPDDLSRAQGTATAEAGACAATGAAFQITESSYPLVAYHVADLQIGHTLAVTYQRWRLFGLLE